MGRFALSHRMWSGLGYAAMAALAWGGTPSATDTMGSREAEFLAENDAAMAKMMKDMAVAPSGDVDRDFAAMMIPHHQGAVDMALIELRYGHNERLRRISQEIIVEQQQEIVAMRRAVGDVSADVSSCPGESSCTGATILGSGEIAPGSPTLR